MNEKYYIKVMVKFVDLMLQFSLVGHSNMFVVYRAKTSNEKIRQVLLFSVHFHLPQRV